MERRSPTIRTRQEGLSLVRIKNNRRNQTPVRYNAGSESNNLIMEINGNHTVDNAMVVTQPHKVLSVGIIGIYDVEKQI